MSILINIGDAIVAELNSPTPISVSGYSFTEFSQLFTAERVYDPERQLEDTSTLRVDVILGDIDQTAETRNSQSGEYRIDIGFRKLIDPTDRESIDALGEFVEEVGDYFFHRKMLLQYPNAKWIKSQVVYPYLLSKMREHTQFNSILRQTFKVFH